MPGEQEVQGNEAAKEEEDDYEDSEVDPSEGSLVDAAKSRRDSIRSCILRKYLLLFALLAVVMAVLCLMPSLRALLQTTICRVAIPVLVIIVAGLMMTQRLRGAARWAVILLLVLLSLLGVASYTGPCIICHSLLTTASWLAALQFMVGDSVLKAFLTSSVPILVLAALLALLPQVDLAGAMLSYFIALCIVVLVLYEVEVSVKECDPSSDVQECCSTRSMRWLRGRARPAATRR